MRQNFEFPPVDIDLNGTCGIDLRRQVARSGYPTPVIFMTGSIRESTEKAALEAGCAAFMRKPFASADLFKAVDFAVHGNP